MPAARIISIEVITASQKTLCLRVRGKHLKQNATIDIQGFTGASSPSHETWQGQFIAGTLIPPGNAGKVGVVLANKPPATEGKSDGVSPDRPSSSEIDVTITNDNQAPSNTDRAPVFPGLAPT